MPEQMDLEVVWSPEAIEDIESIANYISRDSESYARSVVSKIVEVSRSLSQFPYIGRIVPEIGKDNIGSSVFPVVPTICWGCHAHPNKR